jgi:hypothetical protein
VLEIAGRAGAGAATGAARSSSVFVDGNPTEPPFGNGPIWKF